MWASLPFIACYRKISCNRWFSKSQEFYTPDTENIMMGSVFTDLIEMLESRYGIATTQKIIDRANLKNGGAFTRVGYYSRTELELLLESLIQEFGGSEKEWLYTLGYYMAQMHSERNPGFYTEVKDFFTFLLRLNELTEARVATLYPNATLPTFAAKLIDKDTIEFLYTSPNRLGDLTTGWVTGNADHYGEKVKIEQNKLSADGSRILFIIRRTGG